ncbi:ribosome maturation factor RimM [Aquisediminimonas sediminicola]|uniref:ribosome maturation factor RimM n=1 Tax=Alteraquisediminimonas sediminicola TaxID=2676787 RepID=UPI001C8D0DC4|nr:ribosome maturation factor RimM [Aquisediminimonas sediminicola]
MQNKPVTLAVVIGAHGVAGEVRLKLFAEDVESLKRYGTFNDGQLVLKSLRHGSNGAIARFASVNDRNAAEAMRGTELTVPRSALPPLGEGEYYFADLVGLPCFDSEGTAVGTCIAAENFGASDVIEIERPDKKRFMVPIQVVTIASDQLVIDSAFCE